MDQLNENGNFHLSLKAISCSKTIFFPIQTLFEQLNLSFMWIDASNDLYSQLQEAYQKQIDYILMDEDISFINSLYVLLNDNHFERIKPYSKVIYSFHDNHQINQLKAICQKKRAEMIKASKISFCKDINQRDMENILYELRKQLT